MKQIIRDASKPKPKKWKRPPAVYNNLPGPMGIADECHGRKLLDKGRKNNIFSKYKFS